MDILRIPCANNKNDYIEISLTEECPNCNGQRTSCSKCFGQGKVYTKTGQDIIDFMTPHIKDMMEDAIQRMRYMIIKNKNEEKE